MLSEPPIRTHVSISFVLPPIPQWRNTFLIEYPGPPLCVVTRKPSATRYPGGHAMPIWSKTHAQQFCNHSTGTGCAASYAASVEPYHVKTPPPFTCTPVLPASTRPR